MSIRLMVYSCAEVSRHWCHILPYVTWRVTWRGAGGEDSARITAASVPVTGIPAFRMLFSDSHKEHKNIEAHGRDRSYTNLHAASMC